MPEALPDLPTVQVTVDGFEHVFSDRDAQGTPQDCSLETQGIPVDEAAKALGISARAVLKRLQKGTLKGFKVGTKFGDKWLVAQESIPQEIPLETQGIPIEVQGIPPEIPLETQGVPIEVQGIPPEIPLETQGVPIEIVQELMRKVEILTYRNGYLEAQLSEKETHIKLLTDSQHKPSWWSRFCTWFMGRS